MRPHELVHRVRELITMRRLAAAHRRARASGRDAPGYRECEFCVGKHRRLPDLPWYGPDPATRPEVLAGHWPALGYRWQWRDDPDV